MMMDKDTVLPVGAGLRLCEVGGANQWKPGMSDAPGLGPGIISCQLQVERVPDLTWFMWGNMVIEATSNPLTLTLALALTLTLTLTRHPDQVIEATKPSVDRCWYLNPYPNPNPNPNPTLTITP